MARSVVAEGFDCMSGRRPPPTDEPAAAGTVSRSARVGGATAALCGVFDGQRPVEPAWPGQWASLKYV